MIKRRHPHNRFERKQIEEEIRRKKAGRPKKKETQDERNLIEDPEQENIG